MREMMMCHAHFGECRWSSVFLLSTLNSAVASPTAPLDGDIDSQEPPPSSGHLNHKHLSCVATATSTISFVPGTSQSVFWIIWMVGNWRCTQLGYRRSCRCTGSVRSSTLSVAEVEWSPLSRCSATLDSEASPLLFVGHGLLELVCKNTVTSISLLVGGICDICTAF